MQPLSPLVHQLIEDLQILPGVGPKTAQRMAFKLLLPKERARGLQLAQSLSTTLNQVRTCALCRNYTETELCPICANPNRDSHKLCIVENPMDILAIESTGAFNGRYFVLQGLLSPIDGMGPQELGLADLGERLENEAIEEIILATDTSLEGEATAQYIHQLAKKTTTQVSRLATGVPIGGELEYLDAHTLSEAMRLRQTLGES